MKKQIIFYILFIIEMIASPLVAQRPYKGDYNRYLRSIERQLDDFYQMTVDCALDPEDQSMLIESIKSNYLDCSSVCIPDFMDYSDTDGMYSYENYIAHFTRQYGKIVGNSVLLEFQQNDFNVENIVFTEDDNGLLVNVSFNNQLTNPENGQVLFTSRSQAVVIFPDMTKLDSKIRQISVWDKGSYSKNSFNGGSILFSSKQKTSKNKLRLSDSDVNEFIKKGDAAYKRLNYTDAIKYYQRASSMGSGKAFRMLGLIYEYGCGVEPNFEMAFNFYMSAAKLNDIEGVYYVGLCYRKGRGTEKNKKLATEMFRIAADAGYEKAKHELHNL